MNWFKIQIDQLKNKLLGQPVEPEDQESPVEQPEETPHTVGSKSLYTFRRRPSDAPQGEAGVPPRAQSTQRSTEEGTPAKGTSYSGIPTSAPVKRPTAAARPQSAARGVADKPTAGVQLAGQARKPAPAAKPNASAAKPMPVQQRRPVAPAKAAPVQQDDADFVEQPEGQKFSLFRKRTKAPNALFGVAFTSLQLMIFVLLVIGVAGVGGVVGIAKAYVDTTPVLNIAKIQDQNLTSFIYDGNGKLLTQYSGIENRLWVSVDDIPQNLRNAVISIEDNRFMTHNGVDIKRIVGTFFSNMNSDATQGGSTITQQLIKMTLLTTERTYKRKIQEAWLAMQLETQYSKEQILEAYLNTIPLGQSNYGVKAAAKDYFGKSLDQLTLRECAMIAGLTQSPYLYDPRRNTYTRQRMDITNKRTNTVLMRMYELGYIDKAQYETALKDDVKVLPENTVVSMYDHPYFIEYAIDDIITHMLKERNLENTKENRNKIDDELRTGGYNLYLTMDPQIQQTAETTIYNYNKYPKMKLSKYNTKTVQEGDGYTKLQEPQAAAVILDYHTGQIKAIVGGRQQPKSKRTLNRAYQAAMPVGSSIKPIAVYGPAIDLGMSPGSVVLNAPAPIKGWNTSKGYPGGSAPTGTMSIREAVVHSVNNVAARVLMDDVTIDKSLEYLKNNGVRTDLPRINKTGAGLALGTSGVTPVEMSAAFGTFGNKGEYLEPLSFTKIVDSKGNTVLDAEKIRVKTQVFKPSTAWMMVDVLLNAVRSGTGSPANLRTINTAGKTGTNSANTSVFFTGITPYYSCAMWIGHDDYEPMAGSATTGGRTVGPLWKLVMQKVHADKGLKNKAIISDSPGSLGLVHATVCGVSGLRATEACSHDAAGFKPVTDWFLKGTVPSESCNMHYEEQICSLSKKMATQYCPVDEVTASSVLFVPKDSPIRKMTPANILKFFPTALLDFPDISDLKDLNPDNPDYAEYFCPVHTEEWATINTQFESLSTQAKALITEVKNKMKGIPSLPQNVKNSVNNKITGLQAIIAAGTENPNVPAATALQQLQAAYDDLKAYADAMLIAPTPSPTAAPTLQPTQEPTQQPTQAPTPTPTPTQTAVG